MVMMSGFIGIVILVEPAKPGEYYIIIIIGKIVQEEREKIYYFFTRHCKQLKTVVTYIIS